jgi:hypothetical protein
MESVNLRIGLLSRGEYDIEADTTFAFVRIFIAQAQSVLTPPAWFGVFHR